MPTLKVAGLKKPLAIDSIIWIEGDGNYARLHLMTNETHLLSQTLKNLEHHLPAFVRIHKSALVNSAHITKFEQYKAKEAHVVMVNGQCLPIAYRRIYEVRARLGMVTFQAQSFPLQTTYPALN